MKIVCIGDSLTYGYKLKRSEAWVKIIEKKYGVEVLNKGINGDSTGGMLSRFYKDVVENKPYNVFIMGGSNDLIMEVPLSVIMSNIFTMVHQARSNNIIPIIGTPPLTEPEMAKKHWCNITDFVKVNEKLLELREMIMEFSKIFGVSVADICGELDKNIKEYKKHEIYIDGLHLTSKGNEMISDIISSYFAR